MTEDTAVNPLNNMIDYITQSEFQKANDIFNDILGQRVSDALDQEKIGLAQTMYSAEEESDEYEMSAEDDDVDMDISDEEMEAAMDDLENDDEEV